MSTTSLNAPLDLNARRRAALAEVDNAKFGWFHVRVSMQSEKYWQRIEEPLDARRSTVADLLKLDHSGLRDGRRRFLHGCV